MHVLLFCVVVGCRCARDVAGGDASRLSRTYPYRTADAGPLARVVTQTCGYLLVTTARDQFTVLGAPCYRVCGCVGPLHRSFIVVRRTGTARELEDLRGGRFAINEPGSNSGMNLPRRLFAPLACDGRFFSATTLSGSHAASDERDVAALRSALREVAHDDALAALREELMLDGIDDCDAAAYDVLMDYERDAARLQYPVLR